jgi:predicted AAA+ superfamily ATPase
MAEQFAAQELLTFSGNFDDPELFYWTREARNSNAEVDFIFQHKNQIYPIEVKAGKSGTLKSLYVYLYEKKLRTGIRFNIDLPSTGHFKQNVRTGGHSGEIAVNLISLPLYMISQLPRLLDQLPNNEAGRFDDLMI